MLRREFAALEAGPRPRRPHARRRWSPQRSGARTDGSAAGGSRRRPPRERVAVERRDHRRGQADDRRSPSSPPACPHPRRPGSSPTGSAARSPRGVRAPGQTCSSRCVELRAARARAHRQPPHRLPDRRPGRGRAAGDRGRRGHRGHPGLQRVLLRALQELLRRRSTTDALAASRSWSPPPPAPPATPWCSTTRCGRCSPTCAPSSYRPASSPPPRLRLRHRHRLRLRLRLRLRSGSSVTDGSLSARIDRAAGESAPRPGPPPRVGPPRRPVRRSHAVRGPSRQSRHPAAQRAAIGACQTRDPAGKSRKTWPLHPGASVRRSRSSAAARSHHSEPIAARPNTESYPWTFPMSSINSLRGDRPNIGPVGPVTMWRRSVAYAVTERLFSRVRHPLDHSGGDRPPSRTPTETDVAIRQRVWPPVRMVGPVVVERAEQHAVPQVGPTSPGPWSIAVVRLAPGRRDVAAVCAAAPVADHHRLALRR